MTPDTLLAYLHEREIDFRAAALLWGLALVPVLLVGYVAARRARHRVAGAFSVRGRPPRPHARVARAFALLLLLCGLAALAVGFARPVVPLATPEDKATVVLVWDASTTMRATDVKPTRFEAARAAARSALAAVPERAQVALVAYSQTAYILTPPTHDHGAAGVAISQARTAEGAAPGDAIVVALAAIPAPELGTGNDVGPEAPSQPGQPGQGAAPAPGGTGAPAQPAKVPSAIVLIGSGEVTTGRPFAEAAAAAQQAGVPVHTVAIGPRQPGDRTAPYDDAVLRQVAQFTGGRFLQTPSSRDWNQLLRDIGASVTIRRMPQEVGHFVGAAGLVLAGLSMAVSLLATRRLV